MNLKERVEACIVEKKAHPFSLILSPKNSKKNF